LKEDAGGGESSTVYRESQGSFSVLFHLLLPGISIMFIWLAVVCAQKDLAWAAVLCGVIAGILVFSLITFWRLKFIITDECVTFGFGILKKVFPRSRIISCEPYQLTLKNYLGYGIRVGVLDGTIAYNTRSGKGIKMVIDGKKRPYVVSVDNPEHVIELLNPTRDRSQ